MSARACAWPLGRRSTERVPWGSWRLPWPEVDHPNGCGGTARGRSPWREPGCAQGRSESVEKLDFAEQRDGLLRSIEQDQEEVRGAVQELTSAARSTIDVREYIRESPLAWVMGGV